MSEIKKAIVRFCKAKDLKPSDHRVNVTTHALEKSGYSEAQIMWALTKLFEETTQFPDVSYIYRKLRPTQEQIKAEATLLVGHIIKTISNNPQGEVKDLLCPISLEIVENFGGVFTISSTENMTAMRAQLRDIAIAVLTSLPISNVETTHLNMTTQRLLDRQKELE